jgi:hypothetical protein
VTNRQFILYVLTILALIASVYVASRLAGWWGLGVIAALIIGLNWLFARRGAR